LPIPLAASAPNLGFAMVSPVDSVASLSTPQSIPTRLPASRADRVHVRHLDLERDAPGAAFLGERAGADRCMVWQRPVQIKFQPPGHAFEDQSAIGQSDPAKFAEAERAPPMPRFEAREAGFAALGPDATEEGLKGFGICRQGVELDKHARGVSRRLIASASPRNGLFPGS